MDRCKTDKNIDYFYYYFAGSATTADLVRCNACGLVRCNACGLVRCNSCGLVRCNACGLVSKSDLLSRYILVALAMKFCVNGGFSLFR